MRLSSLKITTFRNLSSLAIEPAPGFNLIYGPNGCGKTSVLEAIYLLGMARSFRSSLLNRTIQYDATSFTIVGSAYNANENPVKLGIEKHKTTKIKIKISNEENPSPVALARLLPVKLINPDSYSLLSAGPKYRRQFLDWGLFHVEPNFFPVWQRFQRVLKQRNAALQQRASVEQVRAWNNELVLNAYELASFRKKYVHQLFEKILLMMESIFKMSHFELGYYAGWDEQRELSAILDSSYARDAALGYTQFGPQRADLELKINALPVQNQLSRGEQKMLVYILQLAQGALFRELTGKSCIYLVDDLAAELDDGRRQTLLQILQDQAAQVFITATDVGYIDSFQTQESGCRIDLSAKH